MVEFLTLFLGLVSGPQEVAVVVGEGVAAVELRVDGARVGRLAAEPWKARVDLGSGLEPRELAAVAFDASAAEIGRATQTLNKPRPQAEARILFERQGGRVTAAKVTWESLEGRLPLRSRALLDGAPLAVTDPARIPLPEVDPERFHVLQVELQFAGDVTARAHAAFGGQATDLASSTLTAVPLLLDKPRDPRLSTVQRWFAPDGRQAKVVGLEKGAITVSLVRGAGVIEAMEGLQGRTSGSTGPGVVIASGSGAAGAAGAADLNPASMARQDEALRGAMGLDGDYSLQLLMPVAKPVRHQHLDLDLFAASPEITAADGGLYWALTRRLVLPGAAGEQRIADAVAIAGLRAASGNLRRAVVLVLADDASDASQHSAAEVRGFLEAAGVPLYVWLVGDESAGKGWPGAETIESFQDLRRAVRRLDKDLARQRIAWIETSDSGTAPGGPRLAANAAASRLGVSPNR